ncbi:LysR family transcriptional regulator [Celerinatantimonas sp. MCCC 1A17872]|uniref:LysR family transcriptional regulator n=1 Tax=Celerinatantimonas sp. MCCC 1A17872 TaxID=3177514 RepID=UPI0038C89D8B
MARRQLSEKDLRSLRILMEVAQAEGISAAESQLNMTKATISRHIKEIEENLGTRLCFRGPQGFSLTAAGEKAIEYTRPALQALERIDSEVAALSGVISGKVEVGMIDNILGDPHSQISKALSGLLRIAPEADLNLKTMSSNELMQSLYSHQLDIVIKGTLNDDYSSSLNYLPLFQEEHAFCYCDFPGMPHWSTRPLIYRRNQRLVARAMRDYGFKRGPEAVGLESVATLLSTGLYIGILPLAYMHQMQRMIPFTHCQELPIYQMKLYAITHQKRNLSPAAHTFLELLKVHHAA